MSTTNPDGVCQPSRGFRPLGSCADIRVEAGSMGGGH
jgi:hypothetical protein